MAERISERFACMRSLVQFLPALGAAFPEVAVFTVVMGEFLDLASWSAVICSGLVNFWGIVMGFRNKSRRSAVSSYVGHESLPLLWVLRKWSDPGVH